MFAVFLLLQTALLPIFAGLPASGEDDKAYLLQNGQFIAVGAVVAGFCCTVMLALLAARRGPTMADYLALRRPRLASLFLWILAAALFWAGFGGLAIALERPSPTFIADLFASVDNPALLLFALVVAAPVFEETLFRGWALSRLRVTGTVVLSAALWALMHIQYGAFEIGGLFAYGLLLGAARHRTGTVLVPIALHCLTNAAACAEYYLTVAP